MHMHIYIYIHIHICIYIYIYIYIYMCVCVYWFYARSPPHRAARRAEPRPIREPGVRELRTADSDIMCLNISVVINLSINITMISI